MFLHANLHVNDDSRFAFAGTPVNPKALTSQAANGDIRNTSPWVLQVLKLQSTMNPVAGRL